MNRFGLRFHHLGLAVRKRDDAAAFLSGLGYTMGQMIFDPEQNVNLILCHHAQMPTVEIIFPGAAASPIDVYVARHPNGIVYHTCFETVDLRAALEAMEAANLRVLCVAEARPAVLFGGRAVSFYNILGMGLIEVIETAHQQASVPNIEAVKSGSI